MISRVLKAENPNRDLSKNESNNCFITRWTKKKWKCLLITDGKQNRVCELDVISLKESCTLTWLPVSLSVLDMVIVNSAARWRLWPIGKEIVQCIIINYICSIDVNYPSFQANLGELQLQFSLSFALQYKKGKTDCFVFLKDEFLIPQPEKTLEPGFPCFFLKNWNPVFFLISLSSFSTLSGFIFLTTNKLTMHTVNNNVFHSIDKENGFPQAVCDCQFLRYWKFTSENKSKKKMSKKFVACLRWRLVSAKRFFRDP